jgi:hypothetical protein
LPFRADAGGAGTSSSCFPPALPGGFAFPFAAATFRAAITWNLAISD